MLIVDDRPENLLAFEAAIESLEVEIVKAGSGEEALLAVLSGDFALILLDVQMPNLDGLETAKLIKQRERSKHIPIVLISAVSRELAHIFEGYEQGVVDYLLKPIDANILRAKVAVFLDLHQRGKLIEQQGTRLGHAAIKSDFLNLVAHELRTPLTAAKAQAQLVMRSPAAGDPEVGRIFSSVSRDLDGLIELVATLFDGPRPTAKAQDPVESALEKSTG